MKWEYFTLGELYTVHNGLSKGRQFFGSGYPFLSFSTVFNKWFLPAELPDLVQSTEKEQMSYSIQRGDVFITRTSETMDELGMSSVALKDYPQATYNGFTKRLRPLIPEHIHPEYIGYYFRTPAFRSGFTAFSTMTTRASLRNEDLLSIKVPLPDIQTQRRIADILFAYDDLIENNQKQIKLLEEAAQRLYKEWFVDLRFPGHETTPIIDGVPEGWTETTIGNETEVKRGGSPRPIQEYLACEGLNWLKISDATSSNSPFIFQIKERIKPEGLKKTVYLQAGSIILSNSATPGIPKILKVDTCIHDGWLYFPKSQLSNEYLYHLFLQSRDDLISRGTGAVFTNLKTDILKNYRFIKPNNHVLALFSKMVKQIFAEIDCLSQQTLLLTEARDRLLPKLMSGELEA